MKKYVFLLLLWVLTLPVSAQTDSLTAQQDTVPALPWPQSLQANIDTLLTDHPLFDISQVGFMIYDLTADSVLYQYNHRHTLRPASNMKLVTAIAALDRLGAKHQLRTSLYYTGVRDSCTLRGDLYCVGGMDPLFDADDLEAFVEGVRRLGIDTIRGRIVADKTMKDADQLGWGWCWDDDNPVLSPLLIGRKDNFTERFAQALRKAGMTVDVQLSEGRLPAGATYMVACVHNIGNVLPKMMKDSDNLYAESLFYQLAATSGARPASAKHARQVITKLIEKLGLPSSAYHIADGSGLSLYNYLSPELEVALLRYAWSKESIRKPLYVSLPIAGRDGTLSKRMKRTVAEGNVHAKTGTLKGVTTLAGYCTAANGHMLCFAIMNQGVLKTSNGRDFQDRLCILMCQP
jgi:D-alanyl-D-alanine carboxypeptidase/D-alanyl-D-alanine-endopeptidase (penicillin-binding protein 4)